LDQEALSQPGNRRGGEGERFITSQKGRGEKLQKAASSSSAEENRGSEKNK